MSDGLAGLLVGFALCGLGGLLVPLLIGRVPEPRPPSAPAEDADPPKETYAAIAALPGLTWKAALAAALVGALVGAGVGPAWPLLLLLPLVPVGVALAVIDWRTMLLPTRIVAPSYVVVVVLVLLTWALSDEARDTDDLVRAGWGWLVYGGSFFVLWFLHPRGLGYGDVRLSGVLGIALGYLGWGELLVGLYAGFLLGGVGGGLLSLLRIVERRAFPFGPFMLVGALLGVLVGAPVLAALFGGSLVGG